MSVTLSNQYLGLGVGPIENQASTIVNAICGDASLKIGDVVRLLPQGTGVGFTQPEDLLPRVGIVNSFGIEGYGIVVGGDVGGEYSDGVINLDSNNLALGIIAAFFGEGVTVCTQGRCLALVDGTVSGAINVGDGLIPTPTGLVKSTVFDNRIITRALQPTAKANSIIAVDVKREGGFSKNPAFKKELTVLASDVTGASPLVDFPLLVSITDTDLRDNARADGFDIFFTKSDGFTIIPYDRESYDGGTGKLVAWVLTDLSDTVDNKIFMFYGDPNATDQQNPLPVWDTRFNDVYHFNETIFPYNNSSVGKDFTLLVSTETPFTVSGQMDDAVFITNEDRGMVTPNTVNVFNDDYFITSWVQFDAIGTGAIELFATFKSSTSGNTIEISPENPPNSELFATILQPLTKIFIGDMVDLSFHHIAVRYTSATTTLDLFFDGALISSNSFTPTTPVVFNAYRLGADLLLGDETNGRVDELRVAYNSNFSNGFVTTSFDNQKDSGQGAGNFVKVGSQQPA